MDGVGGFLSFFFSPFFLYFSLLFIAGLLDG